MCPQPEKHISLMHLSDPVSMYTPEVQPHLELTFHADRTRGVVWEEEGPLKETRVEKSCLVCTVLKVGTVGSLSMGKAKEIAPRFQNSNQRN